MGTHVQVSGGWLMTIKTPGSPAIGMGEKADAEYIREAVEMAEGWNPHGGWGATVLQGGSNQRAIDALAMQIARQIDATASIALQSWTLEAVILKDGEVIQKTKAHENRGRAMNIIKAAVDSREHWYD